MTAVAPMPTQEQYDQAFADERVRRYDSVDALEQSLGYRLDTDRLESAARRLACPVKLNPPNWQHGRVLYAHTRAYLAAHDLPAVTLLDIGTAKGFSALCLQWALRDSGRCGAVVSVDVLDPSSRARRNSVAELSGPKTLAEFLAPWPEASAIAFHGMTGVQWLESHPGRVHVAFVDGKHAGGVVYREGMLLAQRQQPGDMVIFDDCQMPGVNLAVSQLDQHYTLSDVQACERRRYAIGVRRG